MSTTDFILPAILVAFGVASAAVAFVVLVLASIFEWENLAHKSTRIMLGCIALSVTAAAYAYVGSAA